MRGAVQRRDFLQFCGGAASLALLPLPARAAPAAYDKLLVLVELKGGNDGLNTVVPYADPEYARLRPRIALRRDEVLQLTEREALHPALAPLLPLWRDGRLALIQGVGYPKPNLSHFRSIEIWDTASDSDATLQQGWLARAFAKAPPPPRFAADGVVIGGADLGPFDGGARAVTLNNAEQFARQARLASGGSATKRGALDHVLKVEGDIGHAAARLAATQSSALRTAFPAQPFGNAVKTACELVAGGAGVAAIRLTLNGFDTHQNQPGIHANLLKQLAEGLAALKAGLTEANAWERALVLSYAEFGRRPKENQSGGTDHGTAAAHFALGGRVRGGLYGAPPRLDRLDVNGNLEHAIDFRSLYATALERWWGLDSRDVLGERFAPLDRLIV